MQALLLRLAMGLAALLLASCTAEGPAFERQTVLSNEVGVIYVYRPLTSVIGRGEDPYVTIAGERMGKIKGRRIFQKGRADRGT